MKYRKTCIIVLIKFDYLKDNGDQLVVYSLNKVTKVRVRQEETERQIQKENIYIYVYVCVNMVINRNLT